VWQLRTRPNNLTSYEQLILATWKRIHPALASPLFVAAASILIFSIRCLAVTRYQPSEATVLFVKSSLPDALRAIFLGVLPGLLSLTAFILVFFVGTSWAERGLLSRHTLTYAVAAVVSFGLSLLLDGSFFWESVDWPYIIGVPLCLAMMASAIGLFHLTRVRPIEVIVGVLALIVILSPWSTVSLTSPTVWLPLEQFQLKGDSTLQAFLLKEETGQLYVLLEADRTIRSIPESAVEVRSHCPEPSFCHPPTIVQTPSDPSTSPQSTSPPAPSPESSMSVAPSGPHHPLLVDASAISD
jgi:hypothetical protein